MTEATNLSEIDPVFQKHNEIAFRLAEKLLREMLAKGLSPHAVSNAYLSHGVTLLASLEGNVSAAATVADSASALLELEEAAQVPEGSKH